MHELNASQAVFDFQQMLLLGAEYSDITGQPLDQEKAAIDFTIELFTGLVASRSGQRD
jgi:hypothetical protein